MRMQQFMNRCSELKPHGSVSMNDDTRSTRPAAWPMRRMASLRVPWRSPMLEPNDRYELWRGADGVWSGADDVMTVVV